MKLAAIALDYDGTIAVNGIMDPSVRSVIGEARGAGIAVILATGRRLGDLARAAGDLTCFDAIVAENGSVIHFPSRGRHVLLGYPPNLAFVEELRRRGVVFELGECLIEADASASGIIIDAIHALEQPLVLTFNRGRVMVLPQAIGKSTGVRHALATLRISIHNTLAIGDAENDHDLLDACEVGVAVEWGSKGLLAVADEIVRGPGPPAVSDYVRQLSRGGELTADHMGRRRLLLGYQHDGQPVTLAVRGRPVVIAGEPGSGKSWLAGLICEQLILQGYCVCVIDPEGDYASLEALPGVVLLGGDDPPPRARGLARALRHPDVSVVVDLSKVRHREKMHDMETLMDVLLRLRRHTGLPHRIVVDEAHYLLSRKGSAALLESELRGQTLITYRVSTLAQSIHLPEEAVVLVTRETDPREVESLRAVCAQPCAAAVSGRTFRDLSINEAALLPGCEEAHGGIRRFRIARRVTTHVRHRAKYLDMPVTDSQAFVFSDQGRAVARAHTLQEFAGLLAALPAHVLEGHLKRHDFSRWIDDVFRDGPLAARLRSLETTIDTETVADVTADLDQAIRARYERLSSDLTAVH